MPKLFVDPAALNDISSAADWYDQQRPRFGDIYLLAVQDVFASIRRHPEMFPVMIDDIRRALFIRFPYAALYRIKNDTIQILAVLHQRQHPDIVLTRSVQNPL